mmetsp:Transcript_54829/g.164073  ORF Transcript_54829/g.164073 Transcript_54829/m.164073 type:complete len:115 (-) Transcript_54829:116-460(-)
MTSAHFILVAVIFAAAAACAAQKVEHVVLLVMENRAFDHVFGFATAELPGIDGLDGTESNPVDPSDPAKGSVSVTDANATYVCPGMICSYYRRGAITSPLLRRPHAQDVRLCRG